MKIRPRPLVAAGLAAVMLAGFAPAGAQAAPAASTMSDVPSVTHVPRTDTSYPFNAADHARGPLPGEAGYYRVDLAEWGYIEEEYFLTGNASVYTKADGGVAVVQTDVPYTNRILVRRPARPNKASGTIVVDIYNASNGYDIEDMWRRLHTNILLEGHVYIGVTSKPINVDALKTFDPARYAPLSWYDEPAATCDRTITPFTPAKTTQVYPCTEAGLVWDILTQTGNALRDPVAGKQLLGGIKLKDVFLVGQSQSGMYLNTYVNNFHRAVTAAHGGDHVWDGYLTAAGEWVERPLRDAEETTGLSILDGPTTPVDVDVPWISVSAEADLNIFGSQAMMPKALDPDTRVWQIPGTGHTYSWSVVVPDNAELLKAGRPPRVFPAVYTPYPMEPAMIGALQALIDNVQKGRELPATQWFERDAAGAVVRDELGNLKGGVRYGMIELPLATYKGYASVNPPDFNGVAIPISKEAFHAQWKNRPQYLAKLRAYDNRMRQQGYLTKDGQKLFAERAELVLDRIGIR